LNVYQTVIGIGNLPISPNTVQINDLPYLLLNQHPLNDPKSGNIDENTSVQIFADYLGILHAHILKRLNMKYHNVEKLRICFTKISSNPKYEENFRKAADLAGIYSPHDYNKIVFADTYLSIAKYMSITRSDLELFDNFIICDADSSYITAKAMTIISTGREIDVQEIKIKDTPIEAHSTTLTDHNIDSRFNDYIFGILQKHPDFQGAQTEELLPIKKAAIDYFVKNVKVKTAFHC
jgi:hypothetical protein